MEREIEHRLKQVQAGRRDPAQDVVSAQEGVKTAQLAFKSSKDRKGNPSPHASEQYARSLRELEIAEQVLDYIERAVA